MIKMKKFLAVALAFCLTLTSVSAVLALEEEVADPGTYAEEEVTVEAAQYEGIVAANADATLDLVVHARNALFGLRVILIDEDEMTTNRPIMPSPDGFGRLVGVNAGGVLSDTTVSAAIGAAGVTHTIELTGLAEVDFYTLILTKPGHHPTMINGLTADATGAITIDPDLLPLELVPGDVDNDGAIGMNDLLAIISNWGATVPTTPQEPGSPGHALQMMALGVVDIAAAITVGAADFLPMVDSWGTTPPIEGDSGNLDVLLSDVTFGVSQVGGSAGASSTTSLTIRLSRAVDELGVVTFGTGTAGAATVAGDITGSGNVWNVPVNVATSGEVVVLIANVGTGATEITFTPVTGVNVNVFHHEVVANVANGTFSVNVGAVPTNLAEGVAVLDGETLHFRNRGEIGRAHV